MPTTVHHEIVSSASKLGFNNKTKANGDDIFDKLITLGHRDLRSNITIDKNIGISQHGEVNYLKVVVHPDAYRDSLVDIGNGIEHLINQKTKKNLHSHSGYVGFLHMPPYGEPVGKGYKVRDILALTSLLSGLT